MRKLRGEMHRRMLGNGYCARPVEMDCHFESICEGCTFLRHHNRVPTNPASPNATTPSARDRSPERKSSTDSLTDSTPPPHSHGLDKITRISTTRAGSRRTLTI